MVGAKPVYSGESVGRWLSRWGGQSRFYIDNALGAYDSRVRDARDVRPLRRHAAEGVQVFYGQLAPSRAWFFERSAT
ncbi:MAG: hypothetical protein C4318_01225 [Acidimicrobiia bacterium]